MVFVPRGDSVSVAFGHGLDVASLTRRAILLLIGTHADVADGRFRFCIHEFLLLGIGVVDLKSLGFHDGVLAPTRCPSVGSLPVVDGSYQLAFGCDLFGCRVVLIHTVSSADPFASIDPLAVGFPPAYLRGEFRLFVNACVSHA